MIKSRSLPCRMLICLLALPLILIANSDDSSNQRILELEIVGMYLLHLYGMRSVPNCNEMWSNGYRYHLFFYNFNSGILICWAYFMVHLKETRVTGRKTYVVHYSDTKTKRAQHLNMHIIVFKYKLSTNSTSMVLILVLRKSLS